jgi:hypothetical protein
LLWKRKKLYCTRIVTTLQTFGNQQDGGTKIQPLLELYLALERQAKGHRPNVGLNGYCRAPGVPRVNATNSAPSARFVVAITTYCLPFHM